MLGSPRIESDGHQITFETRKAVAILAYLAVEGGRQPRERLAEMLCPEADDERARGALRRTLSAIRTSAIGERLEADTATARLADAVEVDVRRFREMRSSGRHEQAVALYAGDLLAGFSLRDAAQFEEWQGAQAEALRSELAD